MAEDTLTVDELKVALNRAIEDYAIHYRDHDMPSYRSTMLAAKDALIAAVRAEEQAQHTLDVERAKLTQFMDRRREASVIPKQEPWSPTAGRFRKGISDG